MSIKWYDRFKKIEQDYSKILSISKSIIDIAYGDDIVCDIDSGIVIPDDILKKLISPIK